MIYPMSITLTTQSLFRLSADLKQEVNPKVLYDALLKALERFPSFNVVLRNGVFRYFFDTNQLPPVIYEDDGILFDPIDFKKNNAYLFRITYKENRIFSDFFHGLCDGAGAMKFFNAVLMLYADINADIGAPSENEWEDGFLKHDSKKKLTKGTISRLAGTRAYQIRGKFFGGEGYALTEGRTDATAFKEIAKTFGVTVTALIAGAVMLAVAKNANENDKDLLCCAIPVDLRRQFPSETLLNFTTILRAEIDRFAVPSTLKDYAVLVDNQITSGIDKELLQEKLNASNFFGKNVAVRLIPLCIKSFAVRLGKLFAGKTKQTMLVSNLGLVKFHDSLSSVVSGIGFNLNVSKKVPLNLATVTSNNIVTLAFTSKLIGNTAIEKSFFEIFEGEGLKFDIITNEKRI